jgi:beta-lactam-binding protein with PASTA domain
LGLRAQIYFVSSNQPAGQCVAQIPDAGELVTDKTVIFYLSAPESSVVLFPSLKGQVVKEVLEFFNAKNIPVTIFNSEETANIDEQIVVDQKPAVGTLVNLKKPLHVQIYC